MSRDYGSSLGALKDLASQIGSGMASANQTGMEFADNFMQRYMPTPEEEYQRARRLGAMQAADRESAMMRSPYAQNYSAYRDRVRAAERRIPLARPGMMVGGLRAR
jgi:choline dehydrogenase-like flavoprotein